MGCKPLCSMPHGRSILYPFTLATISMVLSFRTLASCDLISTKWSIDCSSATSTQCVLRSNLNVGILARETYVNMNVDSDSQPKLDELTKVCRWYSEKERWWLLGKSWDMAIISQSSVVGIALLGIFCIFLTSCYGFKRIIKFKILSWIFGCGAIINLFPLTLKFTSDFCTFEGGICDPTQTFCVSSCSWASGSWQNIAGSLMWMSAAITIWLIPPVDRNITFDSKHDDEEDEEESCRTHNSKSVEFDDSSNESV